MDYSDFLSLIAIVAVTFFISFLLVIVTDQTAQRSGVGEEVDEEEVISWEAVYRVTDEADLDFSYEVKVHYYLHEDFSMEDVLEDLSHREKRLKDLGYTFKLVSIIFHRPEGDETVIPKQTASPSA